MFGREDNEDVEARIESAQPAVTAINELDPGYQTVTVEVVSKSTDTPDMMDESGVLRDATGVIDYIVWDGGGPTDFEEGGAYRVETAKRTTDPDGAPQLEIDTRLADIESVEAGVGYLDIADSGGNERLGTATDGGEYEQTKPRMKELLREHGPLSEPEWFAKANEAGIGKDAAEGALESLKAQGLVYELNGEWEVSD